MEESVDDRFAGIDIESLLNKVDHQRKPLSYRTSRSLYEAPEFIRRLNGEETVMEGQSLCLDCKVVGFPAPALRWFKDSEEIQDHPRISIESDGTGFYSLTIRDVNKGDEAAYRCRAENIEGASSCVFFLSVRCKPKSRKRSSKSSAKKRNVSFPPMFSTIVEKVEEEEKEGREFETLPPSPLTQFYYALTLKGRQSWPSFVGEWAYVNGENGENKENEDNDEDDVFEPAKKPCIRTSNPFFHNLPKDEEDSQNNNILHQDAETPRKDSDELPDDKICSKDNAPNNKNLNQTKPTKEALNLVLDVKNCNDKEKFTRLCLHNPTSDPNSSTDLPSPQLPMSPPIFLESPCDEEIKSPFLENFLRKDTNSSENAVDSNSIPQLKRPPNESLLDNDDSKKEIDVYGNKLLPGQQNANTSTNINQQTGIYQSNTDYNNDNIQPGFLTVPARDHRGREVKARMHKEKDEFQVGDLEGLRPPRQSTPIFFDDSESESEDLESPCEHEPASFIQDCRQKLNFQSSQPALVVPTVLNKTTQSSKESSIPLSQRHDNSQSCENNTKEKNPQPAIKSLVDGDEQETKIKSLSNKSGETTKITQDNKSKLEHTTNINTSVSPNAGSSSKQDNSTTVKNVKNGHHIEGMATQNFNLRGEETAIEAASELQTSSFCGNTSSNNNYFHQSKLKAPTSKMPKSSTETKLPDSNKTAGAFSSVVGNVNTKTNILSAAEDLPRMANSSKEKQKTTDPERPQVLELQYPTKSRLPQRETMRSKIIAASLQSTKSPQASVTLESKSVIMPHSTVCKSPSSSPHSFAIPVLKSQSPKTPENIEHLPASAKQSPLPRKDDADSKSSQNTDKNPSLVRQSRDKPISNSIPCNPTKDIKPIPSIPPLSHEQKVISSLSKLQSPQLKTEVADRTSSQQSKAAETKTQSDVLTKLATSSPGITNSQSVIVKKSDAPQSEMPSHEKTQLPPSSQQATSPLHQNKDKTSAFTKVETAHSPLSKRPEVSSSTKQQPAKTSIPKKPNLFSGLNFGFKSKKKEECSEKVALGKEDSQATICGNEIASAHSVKESKILGETSKSFKSKSADGSEKDKPNVQLQNTSFDEKDSPQSTEVCSETTLQAKTLPLNKPPPVPTDKSKNEPRKDAITKGKKSGRKNTTRGLKRNRSFADKAKQVLKDDILQCSPFGPYTLEGVAAICFITSVSLYGDLGICACLFYTLACYYSFCVLRILGILE